MKKESIVNSAHDQPLPPAAQLMRRVAEMEANGVRGFIPLVQAVAAQYGDEAYPIAQQVFRSLGFEATLEQLKDPNEKGVNTYPWR